MKKALRKLAIFIVILLVAVAAYYLYDTLRERSYAEKIAEIVHQEDRRTLSENLKKYLDNPDQRLRARAALAIGRIGGSEAAEILFGVVSSESMDVASTAAFALGLTGCKEYAGRLLDLAYDYPSQVGAKMVVAAGRLADSSMTEVADQLVEFLSHPSPQFREATCRALFLCGARSKGLYLLDLTQDEPDEEVRKAALYTLARLGISEAIELYSEYLADAEPEIRSLAVRGLGRCESAEAEHLLAIALNDSDRRVVATAVVALSQKKTEMARKALVGRLQKEPDEKLLVALIDGLRTQKNSAAIEAVRKILSRTPPPNVTAAAIRYLATVEKDRAVELIDSLVTLGVEPITVACADAFALVEHKGVVPRLAVLFNDPDKIIRAAAFSNLVKVDSNNSDFYLPKALNDDDFVLVALALDVIERQFLSDYLPIMQTMISRGTAIKTDLRRALVNTAGKFLVKDAADSLALKILIEGALDRNYIVRREAVDIYRDVLSEDRSDMLRSAETHISAGQIENAIEKYQTNPYATIITNKGEVEMELYLDVAPLTVLNFIELASIGFYDSLSFHRVVPNFVVQGGDPHGDGWGGPGYYIRCEYSEEPYRRGTVGMATSGKDTGGSQFFITLSAQPHLEGRYTVFGQVLSGMDVIDEIVPGDLILNIVIEEG